VLRGTLHFLHFETKDFEEYVDLSLRRRLVHKGESLCATGGGAHKYERLIRDKMELELRKYDELQMLILGMDFLVYHIPDECYYFKNFKFSEGDAMTAEPFPMPSDPDAAYPYLVVNIGSGVSIMKVEGEGQFARVGGTALGGATFFGLTSILCPEVSTFDEALRLANRGNNANVDLLVRDIYGGEYKAFGLRGTLIAAAFGKLTQPKYRASARPEDLALATLVMIASNVGAIAHLQAENHGARQIMFTGSFLRHNRLAMRTLTYYTDYMSKGVRKALFLKHDGYFGAIGALLQNYAANDGGGGGEDGRGELPGGASPGKGGGDGSGSGSGSGDASPLAPQCPKLTRWLSPAMP
jgi:type II pantothenate kinase